VLFIIIILVDIYLYVNLLIVLFKIFISNNSYYIFQTAIHIINTESVPNFYYRSNLFIDRETLPHYQNKGNLV